MLSRRIFVTTALGAGAVLATQDHKAAAQADRRMIVDAQIHLWKAESEDWRWVPGLQPQLPEPFTIERAISMMDEAGVDRAVIVPPSWPGDRNDYALEAVKRYPTRFRVMGKVPLQDPESLDLLPKWKEQPGMVGLRVIFNNAQTIPWLTDGTADRFWPAAEKAGLPVMCFAPGRTAMLGPVAERHPQLTLILDHMGVTAAMVKDNKLEEGIGQTVALAKYPNVSAKVSASPGLSREPYPFRDVAVHVKRVFDAYGPQRSYWGTDLTNSYAKASYRQRISQFTEELSFFSESDKDWVMGRAIVAASEVDLIGFVEAVCTLLIVIVCPARKCEDRSADDSNSFAASQALAHSKSRSCQAVAHPGKLVAFTLDADHRTNCSSTGRHP